MRSGFAHLRPSSTSTSTSTILIFAAWLSACSGAGSSAPTASRSQAPLVVQRGSLEDRFALTGELEAVSSENLVVPRTPSWLLSVRWLADEGTVVKKGDRVVEFDSSSFASSLEDKRLAVIRTASELAAETARATATEAEKKMEVERKRSELEKAEAEAAVPADLTPRRVYQEKQLAVAGKRDALAKATEDLEAHRRASRLERTVKGVAATRAERELIDLRARLDELTLKAPRDGLVQLAINRREGRKYLIGDQAFPGWVVASLPDLGAMQVRGRLPDVDDGAVHAGMRADCILDAYPDKVWRGVVQQVSPVARGDGREATRRFFDVVVKLDQASPEFMRPGMSMRVEVIRRRVDGALLVPRAAVSGLPGKTQLRLQDGQSQSIEIDWCTESACVARGSVPAGTALLAPVAAPQAKGAS